MSATQKIATGLVLLACLVQAQVIAAGVTRVLAEATLALAPAVSSQPLAWLGITLAAIGSAVFFLMAAIPAGMKLLKRIR